MFRKYTAMFACVNLFFATSGGLKSDDANYIKEGRKPGLWLVRRGKESQENRFMNRDSAMEFYLTGTFKAYFFNGGAWHSMYKGQVTFKDIKGKDFYFNKHGEISDQKDNDEEYYKL
jgi:hypothetical protein